MKIQGLSLLRVVLFLQLLLLLGCKDSSPNLSDQKNLNLTIDTIEIVRAIHDRILTIDAHADVVTPTTSANFLSPDGRSKVALSKLISGGIKAVVMAVAVPPGPRTIEGDAQARAEINSQLASIFTIVADHADSIVIVKSTSDIIQAEAENKIAFILGFQNARALQRDVSSIDYFYNEGVRMFALTHLGHNSFADSSRPFYDGEKGTYEVSEENGGLSRLGKLAIQKMNSLGAIVDISQLSKAASMQAIDLSGTPVIASHSNVRAISDVSRNLSDEEIDLIGQKGGVIHVSAFRAYLLDYSDQDLVNEIKEARRNAGVDENYSYPFELYWEIDDPDKRLAFLMSISEIIGPADVNHLIDHIDYIVNRIGIDHVGIGTDFNHGSGIDDFVDAADAFNVTLSLFKRGYSEKEIEKIWGGNFLRVFKKVEETRDL